MRGYVLVFWLVAGCSNRAAPADEWGDTQPIQEGLSFHEDCEHAPADDTIEGNGSRFSHHSYGTTQCHAAYVVDLVDYAPVDDHDADAQAVVVRWADAPPQSKATCEKASILSYSWLMRTGLPPASLTASSATGVWVPGIEACAIPRLTAREGLDVFRNADFRFAVSARQTNSAGTGYGTRVVAVDVQ